MTFIKQLFTDAAGQADEMATLSVIAVLSYLGTGSWSVLVNHQAFDAQAWGMGLGALIGAAAAGMGYKAGKEK